MGGLMAFIEHQNSGWVMDAVIAARVIANSLTGTDILIDYEHQSLHAAKNGKPVPAAGWFGKLEWREGLGLFATGIRWNDKAKEMIAAKEYRFISPSFTFNPNTGVVDRIVSVAITNTPALPYLTDLSSAMLSRLNAPQLINSGDPRNQRGLALLQRMNEDNAVKANQTAVLKKSATVNREPAPQLIDSGDPRNHRGYELLRRMCE